MAEESITGGPKEFKMPSLEDFQKFIDKMDVNDEEKAELLAAFTNNKEKIFSPDFDPAQAAREAMRRTFFQAGGFSGPNYLYFFVTVALIMALLGFFVYRLIKFIQNKEKPKMAREEKRKAMKTEKKMQKMTKAPISPKTNQSSSTSSSITRNGSSSGKNKTKAA